MSKKQDIEQLIQISNRARNILGGEVVSLRQRLDVPARVRGSLKKHPMGWLGGSLVTGFFATSLFRRKPKPKPKETARKGLTGLLLTLAIAAIRPAVKIWLTGQLKQFVTAKIENRDITYLRPQDTRRSNPT